MYECAICNGLNHNARLHCQFCGTIPAQYSLSGKTMDIACEGFCLPIVAAHGADRQENHHGQRITLKTVNLDYYAEDKQ